MWLPPPPAAASSTPTLPRSPLAPRMPPSAARTLAAGAGALSRASSVRPAAAGSLALSALPCRGRLPRTRPLSAPFGSGRLPRHGRSPRGADALSRASSVRPAAAGSLSLGASLPRRGRRPRLATVPAAVR
ncbi:hypothetical protein BS78_K189300 [Paspalum vaginatum]|uniref:Uncharacterized protein n=1 Tax=Paspalum vaginatum TaxID=158149 RepID=A0A9W7XBL1_9POAL|nr:hypothetical protein BS78_K189300 [Paspalum vaginatum]